MYELHAKKYAFHPETGEYYIFMLYYSTYTAITQPLNIIELNSYWQGVFSVTKLAIDFWSQWMS